MNVETRNRNKNVDKTFPALAFVSVLPMLFRISIDQKKTPLSLCASYSQIAIFSLLMSTVDFFLRAQLCSPGL